MIMFASAPAYPTQGVLIVYIVVCMAALCQTFFAWDHRKRGSTQMFFCLLVNLRRRQRSRLAIINFDGVIQARQFKDVLVVIAETIGEHSLFLAIDANEQGDNQADTATVHIL